MSFPPFKDLEKYAESQFDVPQRFFMRPEFEAVADWSVAVAGTTLPVHSQILASASKVFCGMLQDTPRPTSPITLPGSSKTTMAEALALLRFIYDPTSVTQENIHFLSIHSYLEGVLRLADSTNGSQMLVKCKTLAKILLLYWPSTRPAGDVAADKNALLELNHVRAVMGFATSIKDDMFNEACYTYVSKRCDAITANATNAAAVEDAVSLVHQIGDYRDLLRAGLFYSLCRNTKYTGNIIMRLVDNGLHNNFQRFDFIYKFKITGRDGGVRIEPMIDPKHAGFKWNGHQFQLFIERNQLGYLVNLKLDLGIDLPGPEVQGTFYFFNWTDPSKSIAKELLFDFEEGNEKTYNWTFEHDVLNSLLDNDGVLYVFVTDWTVTAGPTNPPQNNN